MANKTTKKVTGKAKISKGKKSSESDLSAFNYNKSSGKSIYKANRNAAKRGTKSLYHLGNLDKND